MLDMPICHLRGVRSILCCFHPIFDGEYCLRANTVDPDQMPYYVASDLGLHS